MSDDQEQRFAERVAARKTLAAIFRQQPNGTSTLDVAAYRALGSDGIERLIRQVQSHDHEQADEPFDWVSYLEWRNGLTGGE